MRSSQNDVTKLLRLTVIACCTIYIGLSAHLSIVTGAALIAGDLPPAPDVTRGEVVFFHICGLIGMLLAVSPLIFIRRCFPK